MGNKFIEKPKIENCHYRKRIEQITGNARQYFEISKETDMEILSGTIFDEINIVLDFNKRIETADDFLLLAIESNGLNNYEKLFKYLKCADKIKYGSRPSSPGRR